MTSDKRRHRRRMLDRRGVIRALDGSLLSGCVVSDISASGARVTLDQPGPLPYQFTLCLTECGNVFRQCSVVWQRGDTVGLKFQDGVRTAAPLYIRTGFRTHT
jgi:PilZ domain